MIALLLAFAQPESLSPSSSNYRAWSEFIRPSAAESRYESIGWRTDFGTALAEARKLGRPLLVWAMNGDPTGCT